MSDSSLRAEPAILSFCSFPALGSLPPSSPVLLKASQRSHGQCQCKAVLCFQGKSGQSHLPDSVSPSFPTENCSLVFFFYASLSGMLSRDIWLWFYVYLFLLKFNWHVFKTGAHYVRLHSECLKLGTLLSQLNAGIMGLYNHACQTFSVLIFT